MIEDMTVRNLSPATQRSYVHAVAKIGRFFSRSPERLGLEDVRTFQVHLVAGGISWPALNQTVCALRFLYDVTLKQAALLVDRPEPLGPAFSHHSGRDLPGMSAPVQAHYGIYRTPCHEGASDGVEGGDELPVEFLTYVR
jgi:hypothetical protein